MLDITPQERRIVTFLVAALLIGCVVRLARHHLSDRQPDVSIVPAEPTGEDLSASLDPDSQMAMPPGKIDINTADPQQLQSLSGIGPHLARRIVEYRDQHGPFSSPGDITSVPGIGEKTYQRLQDRITIVPDESRGKGSP